MSIFRSGRHDKLNSTEISNLEIASDESVQTGLLDHSSVTDLSPQTIAKILKTAGYNFQSKVWCF